jgi:hypothetical protein
MDWTTNSAWSYTSVGGPCTCAPPFSPGSGDDINIETNVTLTGNLRMKSGSSLIITGNDTLRITGDVQFDNGSVVLIENSGSLIISGDFNNRNNSDNITINGMLDVTGSFTNGNGAVISGNGAINYDPNNFTNTGDIVGVDNNGVIILPIELGDFDATPKSNYIELNWVTYSELNVNHFEIQKLVNNKYVTIDRVNANGGGYLTNYKYIDKKPSKGHNYYRLGIYDVDGISSTSDNIHAYMDSYGPKDIYLYPNPSDGGVNIELVGFKEDILIIVQDMFGKLYYSKIITSVEDVKLISINKENKLSSGQYMIIGSGDNNLIYKKLIVL